MNFFKNRKLKNTKNKDITKFSLKGLEINSKLVNIYDADTCRLIFFLNGKIQKFICRLEGIDAPEMKPPKAQENRNEEIKAAIRARNRLIQLATNIIIDLDNTIKGEELQRKVDENRKILKIKCGDFDKYGRLLVTIYDNKININELLVYEKYANKYDGGTKEKFTFN